MKVSFVLVLLFYIIYTNIYYNNIDKHNIIVTLAKPVRKDNLTHRQYFRLIQQRREIRGGKQRSGKQAFFVRLLLLCGDVEINPGPWTCDICESTFNRRSRLDDHIDKAVHVSCDHCDKAFCNENRLHQHRRTEHTGGGILNQRTPDEATDIPICPDTGYTQTDEYTEKIDEHFDQIRSQTTGPNNWKKINTQLNPDFTYGDLKSLLEGIRCDEYVVLS